MKTKKFAVAAVLTYALVSLLGTARQVQAQANQTAYAKLAPLEQYLMDRDAEIALARTAAPEDISRDATILVLGRHGYETAERQERLRVSGGARLDGAFGRHKF